MPKGVGNPGKQGLPIGTGDSLIAGLVLAQREVLLTGNRRNFERAPELALGRT